MAKGTSITDPDLIRQHLSSLLGCAAFETSERNRKFLNYVVEETLNGRAGHIKAYNIATSAFGRGSDFDPQQDSIVRIEAGRLRRALEHYYLTVGASDPVRITIPVGSYVPSFSATAAVASIETPKEISNLPSLLVMDFESEEDQPAFPKATRGFTRKVIAGLTHFAGLKVYGAESLSRDVVRQEGAESSPITDIDFVLSGGAMISEKHFDVDAILHDARTGQCIWAREYHRSITPNSLSAVRDEISGLIAGELAQTYGIIFAYITSAMDAGKANFIRPADHMVRFHKYWRTLDTGQVDRIIGELEQVLGDNPTEASALAGLSLAYTNSVRFGPKVRVETATTLFRARELAQRAIGYAPQSGRGFVALSAACWFLGDVAGCLEALETARLLNPNDSETMAELGLRRACRAEWDEGIPLLLDAYQRNPALSGVFRVGLSVWHYAHGRYAEAYAEALRINAPSVVYGFLMEAAAAAKLGLKQQAQSAIEHILNLHPHYPSQIGEDLSYRNIEPQLMQHILEGLDIAGFFDRKAVSQSKSGRTLGVAN